MQFKVMVSSPLLWPVSFVGTIIRASLYWPVTFHPGVALKSPVAVIRSETEVIKESAGNGLLLGPALANALCLVSNY